MVAQSVVVLVLLLVLSVARQHPHSLQSAVRSFTRPSSVAAVAVGTGRVPASQLRSYSVELSCACVVVVVSAVVVVAADIVVPKSRWFR